MQQQPRALTLGALTTALGEYCGLFEQRPAPNDARDPIRQFREAAAALGRVSCDWAPSADAGGVRAGLAALPVCTEGVQLLAAASGASALFMRYTLHGALMSAAIVMAITNAKVLLSAVANMLREHFPNYKTTTGATNVFGAYNSESIDYKIRELYSYAKEHGPGLDALLEDILAKEIDCALFMAGDTSAACTPAMAWGMLARRLSDSAFAGDLKRKQAAMSATRAAWDQQWLRDDSRAPLGTVTARIAGMCAGILRALGAARLVREVVWSDATRQLQVRQPSGKSWDTVEIADLAATKLAAHAAACGQTYGSAVDLDPAISWVFSAPPIERGVVAQTSAAAAFAAVDIPQLEALMSDPTAVGGGLAFWTYGSIMADIMREAPDDSPPAVELRSVYGRDGASHETAQQIAEKTTRLIVWLRWLIFSRWPHRAWGQGFPKAEFVYNMSAKDMALALASRRATAPFVITSPCGLYPATPDRVSCAGAEFVSHNVDQFRDMMRVMEKLNGLVCARETYGEYTVANPPSIRQQTQLSAAGRHLYIRDFYMGVFGEQHVCRTFRISPPVNLPSMYARYDKCTDAAEPPEEVVAASSPVDEHSAMDVEEEKEAGVNASADAATAARPEPIHRDGLAVAPEQEGENATPEQDTDRLASPPGEKEGQQSGHGDEDRGVRSPADALEAAEARTAHDGDDDDEAPAAKDAKEEEAVMETAGDAPARQEIPWADGEGGLIGWASEYWQYASASDPSVGATGPPGTVEDAEPVSDVLNIFTTDLADLCHNLVENGLGQQGIRALRYCITPVLFYYECKAGDAAESSSKRRKTADADS